MVGLEPAEKKKEKKPKKECEVEQNPIEDYTKKRYVSKVNGTHVKLFLYHIHIIINTASPT